MGKGGALNAWLKEFTALVFTQTVQAFIYAIIITIILYGMGDETGSISANDNNAALGLMATFALLSVFKVEEMVKKIFGMGDTKASHGNAMKSIAKTAIAAKLGKRVLDNMGKVTGGIGAITKAGQDRKKTMKRFEEDMADNGFVKGDNGKLSYAGKGAQRGNDSLFNNTGGNGGANTSEAAEQAVENASKAAAANAAGMSAADQRRMRNAFRSYEDKLSEIKKARNDGIKSIASGFTEGVGATFGATTGGILGGADGDLDEMLQGIMAGAGVGDAVGQGMVNTVDRALQFAQKNYKREAGMSNKEAKRILDSYKTAFNTTPVSYKNVSVDDTND